MSSPPFLLTQKWLEEESKHIQLLDIPKLQQLIDSGKFYYLFVKGVSHSRYIPNMAFEHIMTVTLFEGGQLSNTSTTATGMRIKHIYEIVELQPGVNINQSNRMVL